PAPGRLARPGTAGIARSVPVLQGLLGGLPGRGGHGDLQSRGALPALPAPAAPSGALLAGLAAPVGQAGRARPGSREPAAWLPVAGGRREGHRRYRPAPAAASVRHPRVPPLVRRPYAGV